MCENKKSAGCIYYNPQEEQLRISYDAGNENYTPCPEEFIIILLRVREKITQHVVLESTFFAVTAVIRILLTRLQIISPTLLLQ